MWTIQEVFRAHQVSLDGGAEEGRSSGQGVDGQRGRVILKKAQPLGRRLPSGNITTYVY